jgi:predicted amino acid racemase
MYPKMVIDLKKFDSNVKKCLDLSHFNHQSVMAVTKVFCAEQPLVDVLNKNDVDYIADSRLSNLIKMTTDKEKVLLRLPQLDEVPLMVEHVSLSLNSELKTIEAIDTACAVKGIIHKVLLMVDLGDLREGIFDDLELFDSVAKIEQMIHVHLEGIGTNLTCYGGVIPTPQTLQKLVDLKDKVEHMINRSLKIVSGGNSSNVDLLEQGLIPKGINNIRLGEALVLGRETAYGKRIDGMVDDVFTLEAQVIECKQKPSVPIGELGMNAFGEKVSFEDLGDMKRVILAVGKQDVSHLDLRPIEDVTILGSSSDHLIIDASRLEDVAVGDVLHFKLTYGSVLSLMTSPYVEKHYV